MSSLLQTEVVGPFEENCYLVRLPGTEREVVIIDPGDESARIISALDTNGWTPAAILNTHGHVDHVGAVDDLKRHFDIPFLIHADEAAVLQSYPAMRSLLGLEEGVAPVPDRWIREEVEVQISGCPVQVIHTPGHTPGSCVYRVGDCVFTGDTLFAGSVGRTDLPGGNFHQLQVSLRTLLDAVPEDLLLYPGHGPHTTLAQEKVHNPFLRETILQ